MITKIRSNSFTKRTIDLLFKKFRKYSQHEFKTDIKNYKHYQNLVDTAMVANGDNVHDIIKRLGVQYKDKLSYKIITDDYIPYGRITASSFQDINFILDKFISERYAFLLLDPNIKFKVLNRTYDLPGINRVYVRTDIPGISGEYTYDGIRFSTRIVIPDKSYRFTPEL